MKQPLMIQVGTAAKAAGAGVRRVLRRYPTIVTAGALAGIAAISAHFGVLAGSLMGAILLAAGSSRSTDQAREPQNFRAGKLPQASIDWISMVAAQLPSVIWTTDRDLRITAIVGADLRWLRYDPADTIGRTLQDIFELDDPHEPPLRAHLRALAGHSELYTYRQQGREFDARVEPLRDDSGEIIGCVAVAVDVTGQRQVEQALRHVQQQLEALTRERAAVLGETNERLKQEIEERKRTEAELRRSEARYRGIVESQQDLVVRTDTEGLFTFVNDAYCRMFGRSREDLLGSFYHPLVHPDDLPKTLEAMKRLYEPPYRITVEQRALTVDGWRWIAWEDYAIRDDEGNVVEIQGVGRDITHRVEVEQKEREQRALAEALRDTAAVINSTLDLDEVLERILANVGRVVPHDAANLMLTDAQGHTTVARTRGYGKYALEEYLLNVDFYLDDVDAFRLMAETRQPLLVLDTRTDPNWVDIQGTGWVRSYAGAPITIEGELLGFLNLDSSKPHAFTLEDTERLKAFADQAAIAIRNARYHDQAQQLAAMEAAMEERQRISRELHDAVSQSLFSASVIAQSLPRLWQLGAEEIGDALEELNRLTRGALAEMRTLLLELRPQDLIDVKLADLLSQLVDAFSSKSSTEIELNIEGQPELTPEVRIALYRITQEALNNIMKHARARHASITLRPTPEGTELRITDDGRGFDPSALKPNHLGLGIMHERAALIGATLEIDTGKGRGTTITVTWPGSTGKEQV